MECFNQLRQACGAFICCGQVGVSNDTRDEQCGLLEHGQPPHQHQHQHQAYDSNGINGMGPNYYPIQPNQAMEQETLRRIVERTAENLIDVTGSGVERLQQADLAERTDEYQGVVGRMGELGEASRQLVALPLPGLFVTSEAFKTSMPAITPTQSSQMQQWSEQIHQAVENTSVDHTGEMVVSLTWTITE